MEAKADEMALAPQGFKGTDSLFFNVQKFEHAQRIGQALATATMIPEHYRRNIGNCLIALNLAERMQADPMMVMQNTYIVHGKPGIEAKLAIALINTSGRFEPLKYEYKMDSDGAVVECFAYAKEKATGEILNGPEVTWQMVQAEGWDKPKAQMPSKWNTMRKLMFTYRAAMFFARVHIPEALLGFYTTEELTDSIDLEAQPNGSYQAPPPPPTEEEEREAEAKAEATQAAIKAEQEDFERQKVEAAQAELEKKRAQAKKDLDKKENGNGDFEKPNMIDWLWSARPSTSLKNAQEWLKVYKENEDTIDLLPNRDKRDKYYAKKAKVENFIKEREAPEEPPNAPGEHDQNDRRAEFNAWIEKVIAKAGEAVVVEACYRNDYDTYNDVPETEFGIFKTEVCNVAKDLGAPLEL